MTRRRWPALAGIALLALASARALAAQGTDIDVLRGRILANDSTPVVGANVRVTSYVTQAVRQVRTDDRGRFSLVFQNGGGDYIVSVYAIGVAPVEVRIRREGDEEVLLVNLVMHRMQMLEAVRVTETLRPKAESVPTEVGAAGGNPAGNVLPPEQQGDLNALAATLAGFVLSLSPDGSVMGFSALGLDAAQNNFTLNGMQVSSSSLPRDAQVVTRVNTTNFDATKGHFSGAQVQTFAMSGGPVQQHSLRLSLEDPSLQYSDRAATSLLQQSRNLQASGNSSGELVRDRVNYNVSWQMGRRVSPLNTLLDADSSGLARLGLTADSVTRFQAILGALGIPFSVAGVPPDRRSENASTFGRLDYNMKNGGAFSTTFSGNVSRNDAVSLSPRALPSVGGSSSSWGATAQAHLNSNLGSRFLDELQAEIDLSANKGDPFLTLPAGAVLVSSLLPDGGSSLQNLAFGAGAGVNTLSHNGSAQVDNTLSWFTSNNRHRLKFNVEGSYDWYDQLQANNELGTFTYNSLADLEAGRASSFVRRIGTQRRTGSAIQTGAAINDTWQRTKNLQFQLGLRADGVTFSTLPAYNPGIDQLFALRTDRAPSVGSVSPRLGFSWNHGKAPEGVGAMFGPSVRFTLGGGIGRFANTPGSQFLSGAIDATGLPSGAQQLTCIGPAVPQVNWHDFLLNPGDVPNTCADGTGAAQFTVSTPRVQTFDTAYAPPSSYRANLGWNGYLNARFRINLSAVYSLNEHQGASIDRNFDPTTRFALASEGGRPVFVDPAAIVPATGAVSLLSSRRAASYAQVMANRGDGESRSAQLTIGLSPVQRTFSVNPTTWGVSYTTVRVRDRVRGFGGSTAGNPLDFGWARAGGDVQHQINANIAKGFGTWVNVRLSGSARSGSPFTPLVGGDVNGDGLSNDRAFIFDPAVSGDSAASAGMRDVLANAPAGIQSCLRAQLGRVADRNSCRGPWSASFNATVSVVPRGTSMGDRVSFTLNLVNPLAGLDALWHRGRMEGWGQPGTADNTLLYVRGFDPATQRFTYEVNQRFGETRGTRSLPAQPFRATLEMRLSLGPSLERQQAAIELRNYRRPGQPPATVQSIKQRNVTGAAASLRPLVAQKDSLQLSKAQADSLNAIIAGVTRRADSLWTPTAEYIVKLGANDADAELVRRLKETRSAMLDVQFAGYRALRGLLTLEQRKRLKPPIAFMIEEGYMKSARLAGQGSLKIGF